jgi:TATA-box binding protein (TBP) (component of TFIID and TFIIIB)
MSYNPTEYRISTITVTGSVNTEIDLDILYGGFNVLIQENGVEKTPSHVLGVVYAEFGKNRSETYYTKFSKKFIASKKKEYTTKRFDNQLTVIYKYSDDSLMNIKMFKNGNIQITGVKNINEGCDMIERLVCIIQGICSNNEMAVKDIQQLKAVNYKVALINSDFKVGFEIRRDKLFTLLINTFDNKCSFEPCIYPGVKIQYFWNSHNLHNDGVCHCKSQCQVGKGDGNGNGNCKKITIAVFQSGCIIITGAQTPYQIDEAYNFICCILKDNFDFVKKANIALISPQKEKVEQVKIMIKKSSIIYPSSQASKK